LHHRVLVVFGEDDPASMEPIGIKLRDRVDRFPECPQPTTC
jgi:hypothetical protein